MVGEPESDEVKAGMPATASAPATRQAAAAGAQRRARDAAPTEWPAVRETGRGRRRVGRLADTAPFAGAWLPAYCAAPSCRALQTARCLSSGEASTWDCDAA